MSHDRLGYHSSSDVTRDVDLGDRNQFSLRCLLSLGLLIQDQPVAAFLVHANQGELLGIWCLLDWVNAT